jgi:hypothetical protein
MMVAVSLGILGRAKWRRMSSNYRVLGIEIGWLQVLMHRAFQRRPTCRVERVSDVGQIDHCPLCPLKTHLQDTAIAHSSRRMR